MSANRAEVLAALDMYRSHIKSQNRRNVELYVSYVEACSPDPDFGTEEEIQESRMEFLEERVGISGLAEMGITSPAEVLAQWDTVAHLASLDGTHGRNEASPGHLDAYVSAIEKGLREKSREDVRETITFPDELRIVAEEVDGLSGPGFPMFMQHQLTFWSLGEPLRPDDLAVRVKTPEELEGETGLNHWTPQGWTLAGGWNSGDGQDASCCVVYCRRPGEDVWKWRYVVNRWEMGMEVFDSMSEFLAWYAHFREESLERLAADDREGNFFDN